MWRVEGKEPYGHTGVVTGINDDGTIQITHARGKAYGTVTEDYSLSYFTGHSGWQGFYRPINENYGNLTELYEELDNIDFIKSSIKKDLENGNYDNWGDSKQGLQNLYNSFDRRALNKWEEIGAEFDKSQEDQDFTPTTDVQLNET